MIFAKLVGDKASIKAVSRSRVSSKLAVIRPIGQFELNNILSSPKIAIKSASFGLKWASGRSQSSNWPASLGSISPDNVMTVCG
jgi:hypothetical protein